MIRSCRWSFGFLLIVVVGIALVEPNSVETVESCGVDQESTCGAENDIHTLAEQQVTTDSSRFSSNCLDKDENDCAPWAQSGECIDSPEYMHNQCQKSCGLCKATTVASSPQVDSGVKQNIHAGDGKHIEALSNIISETIEYLVNTVHAVEQYKDVRGECQNRHEMCSYWKLKGECEANPSYMKLQCAAACQTCEHLSLQLRCPINPDEPNAIEPGDLDELFQNITTHTDFRHYYPQILSKPAPRQTFLQRVQSMMFHHNDDGPWVVVLDNFLSPEECQSFMDLGSRIGYQRSTAVGKTQYDGSSDRIVAEYRTSTNAWCNEPYCEQNVHTQKVIQKIQHLTGIPSPNSEQLQLLKYTEGQFYDRHHDYIHAEKISQQGPRILTIFLYLNNVKEGGGTEFTGLNITVTPQQGRAVIWPNVLNQDPYQMDRRTFHKALPVLKGEKYGANAWIHLRDNQTPHANGCA